jgi:uracil phosphoribosyltransferase
MGNVVELKHPLVQHHLTVLRDRSTPPHQFRQHVRYLSVLLAYEATHDLPLRPIRVETPLASAEGQELDCRIALVPILRAGLGLSDAIQDLIPQAEVRHLGFSRDESSCQPVEYYQNFSNPPPDIAFIVDPMLATGGTACAAIDQVKTWGVKQISLLSLLAAPEGIKQVTDAHPDLPIYTCAIDERLNEKAYIVPGLGDAGDRIFNTL